MATPSSVALLKKSGVVLATQCLTDGYLSHNGQILYKYYSDIDKINLLISMGDSIFISEKITSTKFEIHDFNTRTLQVCVFYGRDRGLNKPARRYNTLKDYLDNGLFYKFNYFFNERCKCWYLIVDNSGDNWFADGDWLVVDNNAGTILTKERKLKLVVLEDILLKDNSVCGYLKTEIKNKRLYEKLNKTLNNPFNKTNHDVVVVKI